MSKIYLLMANTNYEGSSVAKAFASRQQAESVLEKCNEYPDRPACPGLDCSEEAWAQFEKLDDEWRQDHPAGPVEYIADSFGILEMEIEPPTQGEQV